MSLSVFQWGFLAVALVLANLPWLSQSCFLVLRCEHKPAWLRFLEWFILYFIVGGLAVVLERQATGGTVHPQDWEFYVVTLALFMVFAFPGFIFRYVR